MWFAVILAGHKYIYRFSTELNLSILKKEIHDGGIVQV